MEDFDEDSEIQARIWNSFNRHARNVDIIPGSDELAPTLGDYVRSLTVGSTALSSIKRERTM